MEGQTQVIMPVVYDGVMPWDQWLFLFEVAADVNGWRSDSNKMANMLMLSVRGPPLALCLTLDEDTRRDYSLLKEKLTEAICPAETLDQLISQLERRRRQPGESLAELKAEVQRLVTRVYPGMDAASLERHSRLHFLKSISGTSYGEKTIDAQPPTLEEAYNKALFFEQREEQQELLRAAVRPVPSVYNKHSSVEEEVYNVTEERRFKKRRPVCYQCGQEGHIRSNCTQEKSD